MRWRGQEREEASTSLLLIAYFYFLKKKNVLLGIKIIMVFDSKEMNLFPAIIGKLVWYVLGITPP